MLRFVLDDHDEQVCGAIPPDDVWTPPPGVTCELPAGHDGYHEIRTLLMHDDPDGTVEEGVTSWLDY